MIFSLAVKAPRGSFSSILRFSHFVSRWSGQILFTLVSLWDSWPEYSKHLWQIHILGLSWTGRYQQLKILWRSNFDAFFSVVHYSNGLGTSFLFSSNMVGSDQPFKKADQASSSIPRMTCLVRIFQWPKLPPSNMIGFWTAISSFMCSMLFPRSQPVGVVDIVEVDCSDTKVKPRTWTKVKRFETLEITSKYFY